MKKSDEKILLILESSIDGGSVSLFRDGRETDVLTGDAEVSKSGDLLILVETILRRNNLDKNSINFVGVSKEPGSVTGLRIGLAAAQGIADALSIKCFSESLLKCMFRQQSNQPAGKVSAAFYTRKNGIYCQNFDVVNNKVENSHELKKFNEPEEFFADAIKYGAKNLYLNSHLLDNVRDTEIFKNLSVPFTVCEVKGKPSTIIGTALGLIMI